MDFDTPFDEIILFEMPGEEEAERLWLHLQPTRKAWLHQREDAHLVVVVLRAEAADLARLLRELEAWLADRNVPQLQFELDGRTYSLRGRPASVAGTA
ncbi:MAG: hypothetical protein ACJ75L_08785 [Gaiellaceae bacterium]|jgi:hypothetical protein